MCRAQMLRYATGCWRCGVSAVSGRSVALGIAHVQCSNSVVVGRCLFSHSRRVQAEEMSSE